MQLSGEGRGREEGKGRCGVSSVSCFGHPRWRYHQFPGCPVGLLCDLLAPSLCSESLGGFSDFYRINMTIKMSDSPWASSQKSSQTAVKSPPVKGVSRTSCQKRGTRPHSARVIAPEGVSFFSFLLQTRVKKGKQGCGDLGELFHPSGLGIFSLTK